MGSSSKVVLVGATSLIVGVYGISLKKVETNNVNTALVNVSRVQNEYTSDAAMRSALSLFQYYDGKYEVGGTKKGVAGTVFTYNVKPTGGNNAYATVTVYFPDGSTQVLEAKLVDAKKQGKAASKPGVRSMHKGGWLVAGYFPGHTKKP